MCQLYDRVILRLSLCTSDFLLNPGVTVLALMLFAL